MNTHAQHRWLKELSSGVSSEPVEGSLGTYYSLRALEEDLGVDLSRLPVCLRIILESIMRNCGTHGITLESVRDLATWNAKTPSDKEIPFVVSRVLLQDFTGVPLLVDLAAMRDAMLLLGKDPQHIEPQVPVDLVVDHSVQVDVAGRPQALERNLKMEFARNRERYTFLKWGQTAFGSFRVVPPGVGIVHQVNLEYLARLVFEKSVPVDGSFKTLLYPDTLVGTDSHTTMINGLGVIGWGVGGIEAEAAILGQPITLGMPKIVGVHLSGALQPGVTATDLTLVLTQRLRAHGVVGAFVEFIGEGAARLSVADRATIANMAPEYGATMGFFPLDARSLEYLQLTGRSPEAIERVRAYYTAQGLFGMPQPGGIDYSETLEVDLNSITPSVAGPKRPQDRLELAAVAGDFKKRLQTPLEAGGYGYVEGHPPPSPKSLLAHGSIVIAAITSCTNTSNPQVMITAGLLAKAAVERGLKVPPWVKTSLAPGSQVVTDYLEAAGLQAPLNALGFQVVGYGCTTCIGNSGPLSDPVNTEIFLKNLVVASVLSGNRNFEARIHSAVKANYLMSPPLVVAYALAGRITLNLEQEPLGHDPLGQPVFLKDLWPSEDLISEVVAKTLKPEAFLKRYTHLKQSTPLEWEALEAPSSLHYAWDPKSTYIQKPPFFQNIRAEVPELPIRADTQLRALAILGDSVTTDHISPAGAIAPDSPAGQYLQQEGVPPHFFNSYGSRRGNDRVMTRGTFANPRIRNLMAGAKEGGFTRHVPSGELLSIYEAAQRYQAEQVPLLIFAGKDYGMGSSRDWAAKGTQLLGVRAVIASSFERIHRSNLLGFGVLPLQFHEGNTAQTFGLTGEEIYTLELNFLHKTADLIVKPLCGPPQTLPLILRLDTPTEYEYYTHGGILPYVLRAGMPLAAGDRGPQTP